MSQQDLRALSGNLYNPGHVLRISMFEAVVKILKEVEEALN